jgi:adenylosuccinate synthase
VGWLDGVLLRYAIRVNGLTELVLTKLDVLSGLERLFFCTAYRANEETYRELPLGPGDLGRFQPLYEELPGWGANIQDVRRWADLPAEARAYVDRIAEHAGIPIRLASVGPERRQVVEVP